MKAGVAVSVLLVLGLAGCAAPASNGVATVNQPSSTATSPSASAKQLTAKQVLAAGIKFATCMRAQGVQVDDPKTLNGGSHISLNGKYSKDKLQAAQKVCGKYLPPLSGAGPNGGGSAQGRADALKYSACMRSHGISNFPDPSASGGIDLGKLNPNSPAFTAADKICRPKGAHK